MATRTQSGEATLPRELKSPRAKLVYLYLSTRGGATVEALQDGLHLEKITLFSILETLSRQDLVRKDADTYRPT
ncbi:TrmB family transcriptional regulator [Halostella sp. JP-L12]|uniref:TrmB family transcriptional regulator n=1 Tax=Halostella TaxID=1843185 RepID=UPI000EF78B91|nr:MULTISPECIES: TrmB family transcriptional regulator [Halostella]NHN49597.1 TrmB family transcriptional regulator [Halostella sp. JP-L12]